jgi:parvulin-like peptidyl-prolyl isomerase
MLLPEGAAKVFNAKSGEIIGPFQVNGLFQLILVNEVIKAELNSEIKEAIKEIILNQWVSQFLKEGIKIIL